jgi:hypothetical protein
MCKLRSTIIDLFILVSPQNEILPVRIKEFFLGSTHFVFENYTMLIWEEHIYKESYEKNPKKLIVGSAIW